MFPLRQIQTHGRNLFEHDGRAFYCTAIDSCSILLHDFGYASMFRYTLSFHSFIVTEKYNTCPANHPFICKQHSTINNRSAFTELEERKDHFEETQRTTVFEHNDIDNSTIFPSTVLINLASSFQTFSV